MRELAGHDPGRFDDILKMPVREALLFYLERMRAAARENYRDAMLMYTNIAPYSKDARPPAVPDLLR